MVNDLMLTHLLLLPAQQTLELASCEAAEQLRQVRTLEACLKHLHHVA